VHGTMRQREWGALRRVGWAGSGGRALRWASKRTRARGGCLPQLPITINPPTWYSGMPPPNTELCPTLYNDIPPLKMNRAGEDSIILSKAAVEAPTF
jgi:hypothetical protein